MLDSDIEQLARTVKGASGSTEVYWMPRMQRVLSIKEKWKDEYYPCAIFPKGKYANLDGVELNEFALVTRLGL